MSFRSPVAAAVARPSDLAWVLPTPSSAALTRSPKLFVASAGSILLVADMAAVFDRALVAAPIAPMVMLRPRRGPDPASSPESRSRESSGAKRRHSPARSSLLPEFEGGLVGVACPV